MRISWYVVSFFFSFSHFPIEMPPFTTEGVFSHGFVNAADGRKMSKSYNNTIDPTDVRQLVLFVVSASFTSTPPFIAKCFMFNCTSKIDYVV
jgi:hypothetical protein